MWEGVQEAYNTEQTEHQNPWKLLETLMMLLGFLSGRAIKGLGSYYLSCKAQAY